MSEEAGLDKTEVDETGVDQTKPDQRESEDETSAQPGASSDSSLSIVGLGASAGGLGALQRFFKHTPAQSGLAFAVVMHLSPEHESHLASLLEGHTDMTVVQVNETLPMEAEHVYVIPPNRNLSAIDTHLRLDPLENERRQRAPIDHFFRTLARMHGERAVAVVLSGTGSDGAVGLGRIKEAGGLAVVQDPKEAEYDNMPQSAIATGQVDLVLKVEAMPERIVRYTRERRELRLPESDESLEQDELEVLGRILAQLRAQTSHDFSQYKRSTLLRRIARRMQLHHLERLLDYLERLRTDPDEVALLYRDLLITVTNFFRDEEAFGALEQHVATLFEGKGPGDSVRVWSVGCATGEEAYSLAILLLEHAHRLSAPPSVQLFATDVHPDALTRAREGMFPKGIASDVGEARLREFFVEESGGYRISQAVRERVVFAPHNLLSDPPFAHLDLVVCRNVLIYLKREVQRKVFELFHYALRENGTLFLGTSETADDALFDMVSKKHHLYRRKNKRVGLHLPQLPLSPPSAAKPSGTRRDEEGTSHIPSGGASSDGASYGAQHARAAERYAPPSVLIGEDHDILHFSEHVGRYLEQPGGDPTDNLYRRIRAELRDGLRAALQAAEDRSARDKTGRSRPVTLRIEGERRQVALQASRTQDDDLQGATLILFYEWEPEGDEAARAKGDAEGPSAADPVVERLEADVAGLRERLRAATSEYETSREEMKASNEELQSMNEELRSTAEELETSKEELQSINEELATLNQENRHKVEELSQLTGDLQNLLAATDIATLFLDRKLRIRRFTPKVDELFSIRAGDVGRPLADLTHRLGDQTLIADAEAVLRTLRPLEREVRGGANAAEDTPWYLMRMLPYRTPEDRIDGVVLTFVEITRLKRAEETLRRSEERYRLLVESVSEYAIFTTDERGEVTTWNTGAERLLGYTEEEAVGRNADLIFTEEDRAAGVPRRELERAAEEGQATDERWHRRADGSRLWASGVVTPLQGLDAGLRGFAKVMRDNTRRKRAEEEREGLLNELAAEREELRKLNETLETRVSKRTLEVRKLAAQLTLAEGLERNRVAQALHDELQQQLVALQFPLSNLRKRVTGEDAEVLKEVSELLRGAITTTRQVTSDLSPPVLRGEGLVEALRWLTRRLEERFGLRISLEAEGEIGVQGEAVRALLFSLVRELLFNVAKHADIDQASVTVREAEDVLTLTVADGGKGFDLAVLGTDGNGTGLGLRSARERLRLFGGDIEIVSQPGDGTHVTITVPVSSLTLK